MVAASTERRSSDYRSDFFPLSDSHELVEFPRICRGERIRTSDWLIQNQVNKVFTQRASYGGKSTNRG